MMRRASAACSGERLGRADSAVGVGAAAGLGSFRHDPSTVTAARTASGTKTRFIRASPREVRSLGCDVRRQSRAVRIGARRAVAGETVRTVADGAGADSVSVQGREAVGVHAEGLAL